MNWKIAISLLFLAMPLGAQDRQITIPRDVNEITIVIDSITLGITIERPPPDTAAARRQEAGTRATENLAAAIARSESSSVVTWTNGGLTAAVLLGVYYLRKISQNSGHSHDIQENNVVNNGGNNGGNNGRGPPDNRGRRKEKHDD